MSKRSAFHPVLLLLAAVAFAGQAGCLLVAAGLAGGAAIGYAYCKGKVCQAYNASFEDSWAAAHQAMSELGFPVLREERDYASGWIQSSDASGDKIMLDLCLIDAPAPAGGPLTRVCVRVGTFGDYPLSERILHQVDAHLVPSGLPPGAVLGAQGAPSTIEPPPAPSGAPVPVGPPQSAEPPPAPGR